MTTLTILKADILDDLARSDLVSATADAITRAIKFYQPTRFYFNESRDLTFSTVAAQSRYSSSDDADIPYFYALDGVFITVSGQNRALKPIDVSEFEFLTDNSAASGEPYAYCRFAQGFGLYPVPDDAYTVRPIGHVLKAEPATDGEANNVWMTEAYQLIRATAIADLASYKMRDYELAQAMAMVADQQLGVLRRATSQRKATGCIRPTVF
jgi:hypothetical protein